MIENIMKTGEYYNYTELQLATGLSRRQIRLDIQHLMEDGVYIINLQDGKGFIKIDPEIPEHRKMADRWVSQEKSRAFALLKKTRPLDCLGGNRYKSARGLANKTQKEVCEKTGIKVYRLSEIENGHAEVSENEKSLLSSVYGVSFE